jgi:hypothetical protein
MATEKASSPVAQPATQTRIPSAGSRSWKSAGMTSPASVPNASGSRKNWVTPISRSRKRLRGSAESPRSLWM